MRKFFLFILMLIAANGLFAQFKITGKVIDKESNQVIENANVVLDNSFKKTFTNQNGRFEITDLKKGTYVIKITHIGYEDLYREVKLDKNVDLSFELKTTSILEEEVVISATRPFEESNTTHQTIKQVELLKANPVRDIPFVLSQTPSVVVTSDAGNGVGYTNMRIRGTDVSRINFTINGIPLNDPESQGVFFVNMADFTSSLNSIQVQRGVGTSTNGAAAFGASVNMQTNTFNEKAFTEINASYGSFNTQKLNVLTSTGLINEKWNFNLRLSKIYSDGFVDRAYSDLKSFYASGSYYGDRSILSFVVSSGKEQTYQSWNGVPKALLEQNSSEMKRYLDHGLYSQEEYENMINSDPRTYNYYTSKNATDNYQQDHYQLHYSKEVNKNLNLNAALFLIRGRGYYENFKRDRKFSSYNLDNPVIGNDTISRTDLVQQKWLDNYFYGMTFSGNYDNNKKMKIKFGGAFNQYQGDHFGKIVWAEYHLFQKDYQWYFNKGTKTNSNIFTKVLYKLTDNLNAFADLQFNLIEYKMEGLHDNYKDLEGYYDYFFINPKAGANYKLNSTSEIFLSIAVANREPSRNEFRDSEENELPKAEKLTDYELGYKLTKNNYMFIANAYLMDYKNQLVMTGKVNNVGDAIMTNVENSYRTGIELIFSTKYADWISTNTNASFSRNKIQNFTEYVDDWDNWGQQVSNDLGETDISFSPDIILGNTINLHLLKNKMEISLISSYVGRQYIDNTSNIERSLDPYFVNDLVLLYKLKSNNLKKVNLRFAINNVFNETYEANAWVYRYILGGQEYNMDGYFPQAGINFMAGISVRF